MATLVSPGVSVTVTDESQYLSAGGGSVPLIVVATAQNKADASGTAVAAATTAANAGKLFKMTSQRDLINYYGTPFFYSTTTGTPIQGYELNEYGLLAAYSVLGVTNQCYILRADIDLASLVGKTSRPTGAPDSGTYWLDATDSAWGIYEFNATTGAFTNKLPVVITDATLLSANAPKTTVGNIGDYAVVAIQRTGAPSYSGEYFHKTRSNAWEILGSAAWAKNIPTVIGTASNPVLTPSDTITIRVNNLFEATVAVPAATDNTVYGLAAQVQNLGWDNLTADVLDGKFYISMSFPEGTSPAANNYITLSGTGTVLADLGIDVTNPDFYQPSISYGTSAQAPLWTSAQLYPRPTGSVWVKAGAAGNGLLPVVKQYNGATRTWLNPTPSLSTADWKANSVLDATGGRAIPAGTLYAQYGFGDEFKTGPVFIWERIATGPTVVTGTDDTPVFEGGSRTFTVKVSSPGSAALSAAYTVTVPNGDAEDFVTGWSNAMIPYTTAAVTTTGAIQLSHSYGGEIVLNDFSSTTGISNGVLEAAGFTIADTTGCKYGPGVSTTFTGVTCTGGGGADATFNVTSAYGEYKLVGTGVQAGGTGYAVGNVLTLAGSDLGGVDTTNDLTLIVAAVSTGAITAVTYKSTGSKEAVENYTIALSNWRDITYTANEGAIVAAPQDSTVWFHSVVDEEDIMVQKDGDWIGYKETSFDLNGFPKPTGTSVTDPAGPIVAATAPTVQSDGSALEYGDLWIDTSDLENYPMISRWRAVEGIDQWVLIDNTDQTSSEGILFADARWATSGTVSPSDDPMSTIAALLVSDYLDIDAPDPSLYPQGTLLFNTRRSGYNVKQYRTNYFNSVDFPDDTLPTEKSTWVSLVGNKLDGSPYMGRKAQRAAIVQAMNAAVSTNTDVRSEDNYVTLMAAPGYPELQPGLIGLNNERGMTAFIIGDTPMRLAENATDIQNWANNAAGASSTGEDGCVTRDTYLGLFYPSGMTTDLTGKAAAVPASHMMLRTMLRSDAVSYPWLAAAGTHRGVIDNASGIGYIDSTTGEFITTKTRLGIRDVLYTNMINPLAFFTGTGLLNYGNKTSFASNSALDRINVARLINYIRYQLVQLSRPYVFEPNDAFTRQQIAGAVEGMMRELVTRRGLYDYLVVCDESNNTPARVDRSELWIDVAIEPVKAAEFIYIPVRILNTGELSA